MIKKAQIPTDVPHPDTNTPLDFTSPFEIIVYIVIPVVLIVLYFTLRRKRRKTKEGIEENEN